ncbi:Bug family tripartite tricarboxylate transporter substrate binding protein [Ramlibacter tataouinensis]|uniref:Candidate extracytoplasmic binding receptor n=1 Tax=Ramlibacter tataouinensis (strain ATCC BAA-407 / DSM 14655 / LMG 21543 / TTB310) TaxID=365046 RepID=F5XXJ9_RAMTT|nr:tripartite tricarboxylate transporter substrate binding protein [Ramlibacter tataouinensis]AEG91802.1 Candidate extracytoplasmic binding receptor [Ramlibacter tataouinensis TTB310]
MTITRRHFAGGAGAVVAHFLPFRGFAQAPWPSKAVRFVVPFAPGGSSEIVARSAAGELSKALGQNFFVDNKPGASGNIAMAEVARADDQHTLILGHIGTLAVNPYMYDKLPYDANKDFKPVSLLAKVPSLYVVNPSVPARDLKEFLALVKSKPGTMNYGSAGNGSAGHLAMEYLKMTADVSITHIPYKGTGPQLTDLLAGRLEAASVGASAILQHIKTGKLRCIATGSAQRLPQLPEVPTVAEQGFPGFEMTQWYGMLAPASMAQGHVDRLAAETQKAMKSPSVLERLSQDAAEAAGGTPAQFAQFIATEQKRWKQVVERAKIKAE